MSAPRETRLLLAQHRLAAAFSEEGRRWPALCAAVLVTRGGLGLGVAEFARLLGVSEATVHKLEQGECAPPLAPPSLRQLEPALDWAATGLPVGSGGSREAAVRHPSAFRR